MARVKTKITEYEIDNLNQEEYSLLRSMIASCVVLPRVELAMKLLVEEDVKRIYKLDSEKETINYYEIQAGT